MMDALLAFMPTLNYWVIALAVSIALNVWQAVYHTGVAAGLKAKLDHVFAHGHAPAGTVVVPAASITPSHFASAAAPVTVTTTAPVPTPQTGIAGTAVPPWERK
jgi:hypothetical protein